MANDIASLLDMMKGVPSTNGWDVICSYNQEKLNNLLEDKYQKGKLVKEVDISFKEHDDFEETDIDVNLSLLLSAPLLQFIDTNSHQCQLTMEIEGGHYKKERESDHKVIEGDISKGVYNLICIVPLGAMSGDGEVKEGDNIIVFEQNKEAEFHVVLHFKNSNDTTFDIKPISTPDKSILSDMKALPSILKEVALYFKKNVTEIEYALSSVNNKKSTSNTPFNLSPKSFVFGATKIDENGVLSLYIQTENSGNPPGNKNPSFQPRDKAMLPIPESRQNYTSSLIFSNSLMKTYVKSQLQNITFKEFVSATEGLDVKVAPNTEPLSVNVSHLGIKQLEIGNVKVNFNDTPIDIIFDTYTPVKINWEFRQSLGWRQWDCAGGFCTSTTGTATVKINIDKNISLTGDDREIELNCDITKDDYKIDIDNLPGGDGDSLKNALSNAVKPFSINFAPLNFFATTNLLFPGEEILHFDTKDGFHIPFDFIFFGWIEN